MAKILVVVDMQKDFINGSLGTKEAEAIVPRVKSIIDEYVNDDDAKILFTKDTHHENYLDTSEGKNLPVVHCVEGTDGWQIPDELLENIDLQNLQLFRDVIIVSKPTFGFMFIDRCIREFFGLDESCIDEIRIVGLCTDICVVSNALILKAVFPEIPIVVDSSACAGVTPEKHEASLEVMRSCQINVI